MRDESLENLLDYFHRFTACGNPFLQEGCYNHSRLASNGSLLLPAVCCLLDLGRSRPRSGTVAARPARCRILVRSDYHVLNRLTGPRGAMPEHIYTIAQGQRLEPLDEKHAALPPSHGYDNVLITFGETDATAHIETKR